MFIAGSKHASDWFWNFADTVLYGADNILNSTEQAFMDSLRDTTGLSVPKRPVDVKAFEYLDRPRHKKQAFFEDVAKREGVHTIYGHSRGAAYLADMDIDPDVTTVGLDGAMLIAHNKDMLNIQEGGPSLNPTGLFDDVIGLTGKNNYYYDNSWTPHQVW